MDRATPWAVALAAIAWADVAWADDFGALMCTLNVEDAAVAASSPDEQAVAAAWIAHLERRPIGPGLAASRWESEQAEAWYDALLYSEALRPHVSEAHREWLAAQAETQRLPDLAAMLRLPAASVVRDGASGRALLLGRSSDGRPVTRVSVNGEFRWFALDTGAALSGAEFKLLATAGSTEVTVTDVAGGEEVLHLATAEWSLGGRAFQATPAIGFDTLDVGILNDFLASPIDGIVGWSALGQEAFELHFAERRLRFSDADTDGMVRFDLVVVGQHPLIRLTHEGIDLLMLLDTGSWTSSLTPRGARRLGLDVKGRGARRARGAFGVIREQRRRVRRFWMPLGAEGGARIRRVSHGPGFAGPACVDGVIGADALPRDGRVVVDGPAGAAWFE